MNTTEIKHNLRNLIEKGKELEALSKLKDEFHQNEMAINSLITMEYNYKKLENEYMIDVISYHEFSSKRSKIIYGILKFIDKIGVSPEDLKLTSGFRIVRVFKNQNQRLPVYTVSVINRSQKFLIITHLGIIYEETPAVLSSTAYELKPLAAWDIELPEFSTGYMEYQPENPILMEADSAASFQVRFMVNKHLGSKDTHHAFSPTAKKIVLKIFTDQNLLAESETIQFK